MLGDRGSFFGPAAGSARPLDRLFRLSLLSGVCSTAALLVLGVHGHAVAPALDLVLDTTAFVSAVALTALAWARFRESRLIVAVYHSSAFLVLSVGYAIALAISLLHSVDLGGLGEPEGVAVLVLAASRLGAATLFVAAGLGTTRPTYGRSPASVLLVPSLAVVTLTIVAAIWGPPGPRLQIVNMTADYPLPEATAFGGILHLVIASLFFVGAYASRRMWHRTRAVIDGYIAVGLLFAGFGELLWTAYPSAHPGQVSVGDLFRLACSVTLLVGLEAAVRAGLHELRTANVRLEQLRDAEVERAGLEERARLARELHDGLAQDLWLAKLRASELLADPDLPSEARVRAASVASAVDAGLGEARQAVAALRAPATDQPLPDMVRQAVDECADRYGLRMELVVEGKGEAAVTARTQAEILRILQEALTNVARHAGATMVGIRLVICCRLVLLRVVDNGCGFDPAQPTPGHYGLESLRERAALVGGRVRIASRPGDGTRVQLTVPLGSGAGEPGR